MDRQGGLSPMFSVSARGSLLLGIALGLVPAAALAQSAPAAPTREELDMRTRPEQPAEKSRLTVDGGFERGTCALADPAMAGIRVNFARVTFTGLPGIDPAELESTWSGLAGSDQPLASLCEVRDRVATILRGRGFLAAVQVPPQRIEKGGEVRMEVLAARLADVEVRGHPGNAERQIAAHLRRLTSRKWFNIHEAERQLLLLRDLPGFDVRLTLRPAHGAPGDVIGQVSVRRRPVEILLGGQNLGSKATGREGVVAQVTLNDLTGMGDRTVLGVYNTLQTHEQTVVSLRHDFALGADGLRLGARVVYGHARPDVAGGNFASRTWIEGVDISYPFVRSQATNVDGSAGLDRIDQAISFAGTRINRDRLTVAWARVGIDTVDAASVAGRSGYTIAEPRLRLAGEVEVRKGVAGLGASRPCTPLAVCLPPNVPITNLAANPQAALVRAEGKVEVRPTRQLALVFEPRGQYSGSQLLSYEQFTLGNYTVGRGYDPAVAQGDSGLGGSLELRWGRMMPKGPEALALQPYAFVDAGWVWTNDNGLTPTRHLVSAGAGARLRWGDHGDLNLALAVPLERLPGQTSLPPARLLVTFSTRFVPWTSQ